MSTTLPTKLSLLRKMFDKIDPSDELYEDMYAAMSPVASDIDEPESAVGFQCSYAIDDSPAGPATRRGFINAYDASSGTYTVLTPGIPGAVDASPSELRVYFTLDPFFSPDTVREYQGQ